MQATVARVEIIFLSDAFYYDLSNNVKACGKMCIFFVFFSLTSMRKNFPKLIATICQQLMLTYGKVALSNF